MPTSALRTLQDLNLEVSRNAKQHALKTQTVMRQVCCCPRPGAQPYPSRPVVYAALQPSGTIGQLNRLLPWRCTPLCTRSLLWS